MAIEIVNFRMKHGGSLARAMLNYQWGMLVMIVTVCELKQMDIVPSSRVFPGI